MPYEVRRTDGSRGFFVLGPGQPPDSGVAAPRCDACAHWQTPERGDDHGVCVRADAENAPMFATAAWAEEDPVFRTLPSFGCTEWTGR